MKLMGKYGDTTWHGLVNGDPTMKGDSAGNRGGGGHRRTRAGPERASRSGPRDPGTDITLPPSMAAAPGLWDLTAACSKI